MSSCIVLFYIWGSSLLARGAPPPRAEDLGLDDRRLSASAVDAQSADALWADRANLASARRAAAIWSADLDRDPAAFEAAWKRARTGYWLGGHVPESERRRSYEDGIAAARKAIAAQPNRPEGYFWLAANMGALAESYGLRQGIKYRKPIKEALETVLRIDPGFQQGSGDRALGRWYFRVPGLFGGSDKLAEQHLRKSLTYNPQSTASHFFLAEVLLDAGRKAEARSELQRVIDAPLDPAWIPEDQEFKDKARRLISSVPP
jgi:tetratricopeptide (TPR) repeat protein